MVFLISWWLCWLLTKCFLSKVSRNFELVGRVNLDQLEQMKGKTESSSSDEEEKEEELSPKTEERGQCSSFLSFLFFFGTATCPTSPTKQGQLLTLHHIPVEPCRHASQSRIGLLWRHCSWGNLVFLSLITSFLSVKKIRTMRKHR